MFFLFLFLAFPESEPFLTINRDSEKSFHRIYDVAMAPDGRLFTVDRDEAAVHCYGSDGAFLRTIGGQGQGPGEFEAAVGAVFAHDQLWVIDTMRQSVTRFKDGLLEGSSQLGHNPHSINVVDGKVIVAPINPGGPFHVFGPDGKLERTFKVSDTGYADAPSKAFESLWRTLTTTTDGDGLILGLVYMQQVARIDLHGELTQVWDMSDYLFTHTTDMGGKGKAPIFFTALVFGKGPDGLTWLAASEEGNRRECNIIYKVDVPNKKVVSRADVGEHIRCIRYFPETGVTAIGRADNRIELYR